MPMYDPEMSVPSPEMFAPEMRGRTTQNSVSSTRKLAVFGSICAVVTTLWWSSERWMVSIFPTSTPLKWIDVLPASSPSAVWKTIVIVGPSARIRVTATQAPTTAATIGTIHTSDRRVLRLPRCFDSGTGGSGASASGMSDLVGARRVPDQAWIEGLDGEHREDHDRGEEEQARRGLHRHERLELDQRRGEGVDEDVDHRPTSD